MKESVAGNAGTDVVGRVALIKAGSSVNVADIKGSQFRSPLRAGPRQRLKSSSYQPALLWSYPHGRGPAMMVLLIAMPSTMKRRFPLQIHISTIFLVLLLLVGGILWRYRLWPGAADTERNRP